MALLGVFIGEVSGITKTGGDGKKRTELRNV
jgi:hypothetical protein